MNWIDPRALLPVLAGVFAFLAVIAQVRHMRSPGMSRVSPAARSLGLIAVVFSAVSLWLRWIG